MNIHKFFICNWILCYKLPANLLFGFIKFYIIYIAQNKLIIRIWHSHILVIMINIKTNLYSLHHTKDTIV